MYTLPEFLNIFSAVAAAVGAIVAMLPSQNKTRSPGAGRRFIGGVGAFIGCLVVYYGIHAIWIGNMDPQIVIVGFAIAAVGVGIVAVARP